MAEPAYNIGPGFIAEPGTEGGPNFALSREEFIAVQTYVTNGQALPTTEAQFRLSLGSGAPADLSDFQQLIAAYFNIHSHCDTWEGTTFPNTVRLAADVYNYGTNRAPVYYPTLVPLANALTENPNDEVAKQKLKAILEVMNKEATALAQRAAASSNEVAEFANQSSSDQSTLIGPNGDAGLHKYYADKYGSTSEEAAFLTKEIEAQTLILNAANAEYEHDVVVAATTPTYAWIFPVGTIAAAVVAGIYGDKAVKALDRARAAQEKIDLLEAEQAANANLMVALDSAKNGVTDISKKLAAALPVIQKIQGVWQGIADDLSAIVTIIDQNIAAVPPIIMSLGVDSALKAWVNVARDADTYRKNAYVQVGAGPAKTTVQKRALRLVHP